MAKTVVVIGTQWGDEGKGKIVDLLTDQASAVVAPEGLGLAGPIEGDRPAGKAAKVVLGGLVISKDTIQLFSHGIPLGKQKVSRGGFEPPTRCLKGSCSARLS